MKIHYVKNKPFGYSAWFFGLPLLEPRIFIVKHRKGDMPLLAHEKTHYQQYKQAPWLFALRMLFSKAWRYKYELEAFAIQIAHQEFHNPYDRLFPVRWAAMEIKLNYYLDVSLETVEADLITKLMELKNERVSVQI